jgi:VanZ family protein
MPLDPRRRALLWTAFVTVLLLAPVPALFGDLAPEELGRFPADKLAHAAVFVPFGWAWLDAALVARRLTVRGVAVLLALLAWGGVLELLQSASGWRHGEWADLAADGAGLALAAVLPRWWPLGAIGASLRREPGRRERSRGSDAGFF